MIWTLHLCTIYVRKTKCLIMYQLCTRNIEWMFSTLFAESLMQFILKVYYKIQGNLMHKELFLSLTVTQSVFMKLIFTISLVNKDVIQKLYRTSLMQFRIYKGFILMLCLIMQAVHFSNHCINKLHTTM